MGLKIGSVEFRHHVFMGSGLRGFCGEGYWFHFLTRLVFGAIWRGMNFVAKTTTFYPRRGNLPLRADGYRMRGFFPRCIIVKWLSGHILNAVGLSSPGLIVLWGLDLRQKLTEPWVMSFMAVSEEVGGRLEEYRQFVAFLKPHLQWLKAPVIIELNFSCPNVNLPLEKLRGEIIKCLKVARELDVPLVAKFNPLVPPRLLFNLELSGLVDGFNISNTIPYDTGRIGETAFGQKTSPMKRRFGEKFPGGVSGPFCFPYTFAAVKAARAEGVTIPIIAGNGVQSIAAVNALYDAGASAISLATVAILYPWRARRIVKYANKVFAQGG